MMGQRPMPNMTAKLSANHHRLGNPDKTYLTAIVISNPSDVLIYSYGSTPALLTRPVLVPSEIDEGPADVLTKKIESALLFS